MTYKSYTIPPLTPVSMTQKLTHDNPAIFPNPRNFEPERWLVEPEERKNLEKYLQPFGKGSRNCLGIQYVLSSRLAFVHQGFFFSFTSTVFG